MLIDREFFGPAKQNLMLKYVGQGITEPFLCNISLYFMLWMRFIKTRNLYHKQNIFIILKNVKN
jgi:hypothetical protein